MVIVYIFLSFIFAGGVRLFENAINTELYGGRFRPDQVNIWYRLGAASGFFFGVFLTLMFIS